MKGPLFHTAPAPHLLGVFPIKVFWGSLQTPPSEQLIRRHLTSRTTDFSSEAKPAPLTVANEATPKDNPPQSSHGLVG